MRIVLIFFKYLKGRNVNGSRGDAEGAKMMGF